MQRDAAAGGPASHAVEYVDDIRTTIVDLVGKVFTLRKPMA